MASGSQSNSGGITVIVSADGVEVLTAGEAGVKLILILKTIPVLCLASGGVVHGSGMRISGQYLVFVVETIMSFFSRGHMDFDRVFTNFFHRDVTHGIMAIQTLVVRHLLGVNT